jgi:hypothetical protein
LALSKLTKLVLHVEKKAAILENPNHLVTWEFSPHLQVLELRFPGFFSHNRFQIVAPSLTSLCLVNCCLVESQLGIRNLEIANCSASIIFQELRCFAHSVEKLTLDFSGTENALQLLRFAPPFHNVRFLTILLHDDDTRCFVSAPEIVDLTLNAFARATDITWQLPDPWFFQSIFGEKTRLILPELIYRVWSAWGVRSTRFQERTQYFCFTVEPLDDKSHAFSWMLNSKHEECIRAATVKQDMESEAKTA